MLEPISVYLNMNHFTKDKPTPGKISQVKRRFILGALFLALLISPKTQGIGISSYALNDIEVLYIYDDPGSIDWATLYYLNDHEHCRVTLLTIRPGSDFRMAETGFEDRQLVSLTAFGNLDSTGFIDQLSRALFGRRQPDLVLISELTGQKIYESLIEHLKNLPSDPQSPFELTNIFRWRLPGDTSKTDQAISVNTSELAERYRDRMKIELPHLDPSANPEGYDPPRFSRYEPIRVARTGGSGLLAGIAHLRLISILDGYLGEGPVESAVMRHARNFISFFSMAENTSGSKRVEHLVAGYKSLIDLSNQCRSLSVLKSKTGFNWYMDDMLVKARRAVLDEIKVDWSGEIIRRDSPHGPKLKFRAALSVNGPQAVELSYIRFHPYWDSSVVTLEAISRKVMPHQSFVREYLIETSRGQLESKLPDSLRFSAEIIYSSLSLPVFSAVAVRDIPSLSVRFEPGFHFVPPVARIDIDQVVSSMNLKAVITKPYDWAGEVTLNLETPAGLFAGAYRTTWSASKGRTAETIRIPFSVSNLFEQGIQKQVIKLFSGGIVVDADTGLVRIATCKVSDKVNVGLFPDSTGILEDILRMTGVAYQPMTERSLVTADLDAYEVLLLGSGFFRKYPSIRQAKDRLEDYLRHGGSLVIMGQPSDWPEGLLPVSFVPAAERIKNDRIRVRLPEGRVVSEGYDINFERLLSYFERERLVSPVVMAPSEGVLVTQSGAGLLSVARVGEGQIIYCGLPLTEMIADLNLEAIHLLANLLNY